MKILSYLKDKLIYILCGVLFVVVLFLILFAFNVNKALTSLIISVYLITFITPFIYEYIKKNHFYKILKRKFNSIDKKYLITELVNNPSFTEEKILIDTLYEIDKNFIEEINKYKFSSEEFREYIELWCHEIKTPIATSKLIIDNNKNKATESIYEEVEKIESFVEQVLFYSRSGNVEKDYIISKVNLKKLIDEVIKSNKKDIISKKIKIKTDEKDIFVESDAKWLTFIFNQIIVNSIKYSKNMNAVIEVNFKKNKNNTIMKFIDNGIGIKSDEITRVFNKGFTGTNGRRKYNSTGFGLYLSKKMCDKLGINIEIESTENVETIVSITFPNSSMY